MTKRRHLLAGAAGLALATLAVDPLRLLSDGSAGIAGARARDGHGGDRDRSDDRDHGDDHGGRGSDHGADDRKDDASGGQGRGRGRGRGRGGDHGPDDGGHAPSSDDRGGRRDRDLRVEPGDDHRGRRDRDLRVEPGDDRRGRARVARTERQRGRSARRSTLFEYLAGGPSR